MLIVKYKDELFVAWGAAGLNFQRIGTYFKEKAVRHGMVIQEHGYLPYFMDVPKEKVTIVKTYYSPLFQVKYKGFFFEKDREKEHEVKLITNDEDIASKAGLILAGSTRDDDPYELWVPRNEITFVTDLDEDLGFVITIPGLDMGMICYIVDSNKTHLLVKANQYRSYLKRLRKFYPEEHWEEHSDGWLYQWLPKERVYIYKNHDETFRH